MEDSTKTNPYDILLDETQKKREDTIKWMRITKEKIINKWADKFLKFHDKAIKEAITTASSGGVKPGEINLEKNTNYKLGIYILDYYQNKLDPNSRGEISHQYTEKFTKQERRGHLLHYSAHMNTVIFRIQTSVNESKIFREVRLGELLQEVQSRFNGKIRWRWLGINFGPDAGEDWEKMIKSATPFIPKFRLNW